MTTHHDDTEKKPAHKKVHHKPASIFAVRCELAATPGSVSLPGAEVGDMVLGVHIDGGGLIAPGTGGIESSVTVADHLQQTAPNGPHTGVVLLARVPDGN